MLQGNTLHPSGTNAGPSLFARRLVYTSGVRPPHLFVPYQPYPRSNPVSTSFSSFSDTFGLEIRSLHTTTQNQSAKKTPAITPYAISPATVLAASCKPRPPLMTPRIRKIRPIHLWPVPIRFERLFRLKSLCAIRPPKGWKKRTPMTIMPMIGCPLLAVSCSNLSICHLSYMKNGERLPDQFQLQSKLQDRKRREQ